MRAGPSVFDSRITRLNFLCLRADLPAGTTAAILPLLDCKRTVRDLYDTLKTQHDFIQEVPSTCLASSATHQRCKMLRPVATAVLEHTHSRMRGASLVSVLMYSVRPVTDCRCPDVSAAWVGGIQERSDGILSWLVDARLIKTSVPLDRAIRASAATEAARFQESDLQVGLGHATDAVSFLNSKRYSVRRGDLGVRFRSEAEFALTNSSIYYA